ncbi:MAG: hypothetical protein ABIO86_01170 [Sphingomonas sp.]
MDPITPLPDDSDDTAQPPASPREPAFADPPAEAAPTNAAADADTPTPFPTWGTSPPADPSSPSPAGKQGGRLVPDDMAALHPDGGYIAMRLLSRMQTDLAVLTEDKHPATYDEVEEYLGHALVAERIAPRGYTAEQAAKWWAMGGSAALRVPANGGRSDGDGAEEQTSQTWAPTESATPEPPIRIQATPSETAGPPTEMTDLSDSGAGGIDSRFDQPQAASGAAPAMAKPGEPSNASPTRAAGTNSKAAQPQAPAAQMPAGNGQAQQPGAPSAAPFVPLKTHKTTTHWVISADIGPKKLGRLSGRDVVATPAMKAAAAANIALMAVAAGHDEVMAFGYLMPDGSIQVRPVAGKAGDAMYTGRPSGPGKPIFGIHGHADDAVGMVDSPSKNGGFGDTDALFKRGIPMATVYKGQIGWHEMVKGQLTFTAPIGAVPRDEAWSLRNNLNVSQEKFLKPKQKKAK